MKTRNKALLLTFGAVLLVAASVFGTLAYLTATDTVTNTFTVGKMQITLDEALVDANGETTDGDRVKKNNYHHIGIHKDAHVFLFRLVHESAEALLLVATREGDGAEVLHESFGIRTVVADCVAELSYCHGL